MADERDRRHQSQTDRDLSGLAARRERQRPPAPGVPVAVPDFEDLTGRYDGEDLARARAKRPTDTRIARVEKKQDEDRADHKALAAIVTIFRVGRVGQGTADSNMVQLDLIEDYFYVHRGIIDVEGQTAEFPGSGGILA